MSSFHKAIETSSSIAGSKLKNNLPIVSSGVPSLDYIMGGGLPSGALFFIEEDVLGNYSRVLSKYFLAEGIACNHDLFVATGEDDPKDITLRHVTDPIILKRIYYALCESIIRYCIICWGGASKTIIIEIECAQRAILKVTELPTPCAAPPKDEVSSAGDNLDKMKIAWRYESLGKVESSFGSTINFGHNFDLSKHIDPETIKNHNITFWTPSEEAQTIKGFRNSCYFSLLTSIKTAISKEEHQSNTVGSKRNVLRICIQSLGSPVWLSTESADDSSYSQDLLKFMYCLRVILRDTLAVALVTVPTHLFEDENLVNRLLYLVDNAVKLESFAGSSRETNPAFKEYHGLFHITKISAVNSLMPSNPPAVDLAFKLRRKKFVIEKLHLPPELEESSEREQDDITATPTVTCGAFKKKDIDF